MSNLILYYRTFTVNSKYLNVSKKNFNVEDSIKSIYHSKYLNGEWTNPEVLKIIGAYDNWEPFISWNNKHLYFVSSRPPGSPDWNGRIWKSDKNKCLHLQV